MDTIYVAASPRDARYTRICVASIRYFYPDVAIKLLCGGPLEHGLYEELATAWGVQLANVRLGDWGWGFVKLEPLFGPAGERFLVLDSDTALAGDVLSVRSRSNADFLVDDEQQAEAATGELYYDWRQVAAVDPDAAPPRFVFNSGQWFGTAGVLSREDFARWIDWDEMPPKLRWPKLFMPGEQGVLNYVLNQKAAAGGVSVDRREIMLWPGHGMNGVTAEKVAARQAPPVVIHWAGMKRARLGAMVGGDVLWMFERHYYSRPPANAVRRLAAGLRYPFDTWRHDLAQRIRLAWGSKRAAPVRSLHKIF